MDIQKRVDGLKYLIGNTPMLEINFRYKGKPGRIFVKAENYNLTGSIKDRMAYHIIKKAINNGLLKENTHIIEATSGNTGISFAAIGRSLGFPVTIFMPDWMSSERKGLIRSLGADIKLVSSEQGGFLGSIRFSEQLAEEIGNAFLPCQFSNNDNVEAHYMTTGPEIWWQLAYRGLKPDAFLAGVGTGGTIMGVGKFLLEQNPDIKLHPMEPASSPTLTTGYKVGKHRIQGISDEFIPEIVKLDTLDTVIPVDDGDAIIMAQKLASELGLAVGISSGANFIGALKLMNEMGSDSIVATIFSDDNKKYLSTDLLKDEPFKDGYLSADVELLNFHAFKRVCHVSCEADHCIESIYNEMTGTILETGCSRFKN